VSKYKWIVKNPIGNEVALSTETFDAHIVDDPDRTDTEVENLIAVFDRVKEVVESPRYIYYDVNYDSNQRHRYMDVIDCEFIDHLTGLVCIVETDRNPHEIVTYMIKSNLKQEKIKERGVIYDSREHGTEK
jgi:hypothetical protein